jgi:hypothetical protein
MALNATVLGSLMYATVTADSANGFSATLTADQQNLLRALFNDLATAIVSHIQANGQVIVASVSGVTTGPGVSGPGTGTIV